MKGLKWLTVAGRSSKWLLLGILDILHEGRTWKELVADPGHRPDYVTRLHTALRYQGVRVKYQVVGAGGASPYGGGIASAGQTVKLLVHRDDLYKARHIMSQLRDG